MARHWQFVSSSPFLLSCSTPSNHTHKTRSDLATLKLLSSLQTPSPSPSALHIRKRLHFLMVRSFYFSEAMKLKSVQTICALQSETPCAQLSNIIKQRQTTIIIINEKKDQSVLKEMHATNLFECPGQHKTSWEGTCNDTGSIYKSHNTSN